MTGTPGDIRFEESATGGRWVYLSGGVEAEMTFSRLGAARIIVDHTGVPDEFRGQGVGLKLAERMVADMRAAGKTVVALCPFVKAQARRHPEWADVIE